MVYLAMEQTVTFTALFSNTALLTVLLLAVSPLLIVLALIFIVSLTERQYVNAYAPLDLSDPDCPPLPPYVAAMSDGAARVGLAPVGGVTAARKMKTVKIIGQLFASGSRDTMVLSLSGTVIGIQVRKTAILTMLQDGSVLCTTDRRSAGIKSGVLDSLFIRGATFGQLWQAHQQRVLQHADRIVAFAQPTPLAALNDIENRSAQILFDHGLARWCDRERGIYAYSLKGAAAMVGSVFTRARARRQQRLGVAGR